MMSGPRLLLPVLATSLALTACVHQSRPKPPEVHWGSPAEVGQGPNNYGLVTVPEGGTIVLMGDDLLYGSSTSKTARPPPPGVAVPRSREAIPEAIFQALGKHATIQVRSLPGETLAEGVRRWAGQPFGNLLILSYAYGDAKAGTPPSDYLATLTRLIAEAQRSGASVFLLLPPPSRDPALNAKLEPYRNIMRSYNDRGTPVFDPGPAVIASRERLSATAAQSDRIYRLIGGAVIGYIRVAPRPGARAPAP